MKRPTKPNRDSSREHCFACGDLITDKESRLRYLQNNGMKTAIDELDFCRTCANELIRDKVTNCNVTFHGGRNYGPLDTDGGSQSNAIRVMEGE